METLNIQYSIDDKLHLVATEVHDYLIVYLAGSIDSYNSEIFKKRIISMIDALVLKNVAIDMSQINYMSSTGLGTFVYLYQHLTKIKKELVLLNMQPKVLAILKLLGFNNFFFILESAPNNKKLFEKKRHNNRYTNPELLNILLN
jgi:anti-anti-sigma factor